MCAEMKLIRDRTIPQEIVEENNDLQLDEFLFDEDEDDEDEDDEEEVFSDED